MIGPAQFSWRIKFAFDTKGYIGLAGMSCIHGSVAADVPSDLQNVSLHDLAVPCRIVLRTK